MFNYYHHHHNQHDYSNNNNNNIELHYYIRRNSSRRLTSTISELLEDSNKSSVAHICDSIWLQNPIYKEANSVEEPNETTKVEEQFHINEAVQKFLSGGMI